MFPLRKTVVTGVAILGAILIPSIANAQSVTAYTTNDLNLREGPGTSHRVIVTVPEGAEVSINYCSTSESWCFLQWQHYAGWASSRFLTTTPPQYAYAPQQPQYYPPPEQYPQRPPAYQPPHQKQPAYQPPQYQQPVYQPPQYQQPVYQPLQYHPPVAAVPNYPQPYPNYWGRFWWGFWFR